MKGKETIFTTPDTHEKLFEVTGGNERSLMAESGNKYGFVNDFPDLMFPHDLVGKEKHTLEFYENRANVYDKFLYQTFKTHGEDETVVRNGFIDKLKLN